MPLLSKFCVDNHIESDYLSDTCSCQTQIKFFSYVMLFQFSFKKMSDFLLFPSAFRKEIIIIKHSPQCVLKFCHQCRARFACITHYPRQLKFRNNTLNSKNCWDNFLVLANDPSLLWPSITLQPSKFAQTKLCPGAVGCQTF